MKLQGGPSHFYCFLFILFLIFCLFAFFSRATSLGIFLNVWCSKVIDLLAWLHPWHQLLILHAHEFRTLVSTHDSWDGTLIVTTVGGVDLFDAGEGGSTVFTRGA